MPTNTIAFKVKSQAEKHIKQGHPWVFENSIIKQNKDGLPGDLAIIFDQRFNKFLALGLYDPDSPIQIKILSTRNGDKLNQSWLNTKLSEAKHKRAPLFQTDTNAYRLLFGENDGLPGLICDIYDKTAVLKIYSSIWFPYLDLVKDAITKTSGCDCIVIRLSRLVSKSDQGQQYQDGQIISGNLVSEEIVFKEHGVRFSANVIKGHKTGFFLDHRHNRYKVQQLASGHKVLDVFSYAGGFSVHALVGGAKEVTSLDISEQALSLAKKNGALNKTKGKHLTICKDAFAELKNMTQLRKKFDLVIIDPPSFAKAAKEVDLALSQYDKLARLGVQLVSPGGMLLLASCSSRVTADKLFQIYNSALKSSGRKFELIEKTFHDVDHPIGFAEGAYLKSGYYRIE